MPTNYTLIQAIEKYHRYLGDGFKVAVPCLDNQELTLKESRQPALRAAGGHVPPRRRPAAFPALPANSPFQRDAAWRDLLLFHEYFHGETGLGLGAMHQTGWTGLVANLVQPQVPRRHSRLLARAPRAGAARTRC
ncbi:MAG: hypothetical protein MZW92_68310 [Comamonadaceae bacterium]|nr:hypothetical protein [Comamonadaceae bacterium]